MEQDGTELELVCPCGVENFERVIVQRLPHSPIVTDFVACVGCRTMYFAPIRETRPVFPPGYGHGTGGGPQCDSDKKLKRDAAEAAKDYRKPGHRK